MDQPEAVRKHDGRVVAYDAAKLALAVTRAVRAANLGLSASAAEQLAQKIAQAAGAQLVAQAGAVAASADIRSVVSQLLQKTGCRAVAHCYAECGRAATGLLWRLRVAEPGAPGGGAVGSPWDRRRLLESLRAAGVARDPAGEVAREVERRVVALGQERVSPALLHALAVLVLAQRALDIKAYAARRVAFALPMHVPRYDSVAAEETPLPHDGPALEAFWLQTVHSHEVVRAAQDNLLALEPYPNRPDNEGAARPAPGQPSTGAAWAEALDPLASNAGSVLRDWCVAALQTVWVRVDTAERAAELAGRLAAIPASLVPAPSSGAALDLLLAPACANGRTERTRRALPVTLNLAGLMVREALRDQARVTVRLAQMAAVAAQAQREREEYFGLSPVRGRQLPVAIAGLWNAAAWLQGESFEGFRITRQLRTLAVTLVTIVHGAVATLRDETGMELALVGGAPAEAVRRLWRGDREFLLRDGVALDPVRVYDGGPTMKLVPAAEDLAERIDFAKAIGVAFDEPAAVVVEAPLGEEPEPAAWREFLAVLAQAGVPRLRLVPGGGVRALKTFVRTVRAHLEGFPLFEQPEAGIGERGAGSGERGK
ncbi:MAG: ATP cone domain-containing protein [Planctomycetota bacterium]